MSRKTAAARGSAALIAVLGLGVFAGSAEAAPKSKVRFSTSAFQANEGDGTASITVIRTRQLHSAASVVLTNFPGTASPNVDYSAAEQAITFPALPQNEHAKSQAVTVQVPVFDDGSIESNETVNLGLRSTSSAQVVRGTATLTIIDNDGAGRISFQTTDSDRAENAGTATLNVVRAGDISGPAQVSYGATGGTAPAADYSLPNGTLAFAAGESVKTLSVGLADNDATDGNRTVVLGLSAPVGTQLSAPSSTTLTIIDDETPSLVRFEVAAVTPTEDGGSALLTVTRAGTYTGEAVTVAYDATEGTATSPEDYDGSAGTITLEGPDPDLPGDPGDETATIEVLLEADTADEADETFDVALSNPSSNATLGAPVTKTVTILDDDEPAPDPTPTPTSTPTPQPTSTPTPEPTSTPTSTPTPQPTSTPTPQPTSTPSPDPTSTPSPDPTSTPSPDPTSTPSPDPTSTPSPDPTADPSADPNNTSTNTTNNTTNNNSSNNSSNTSGNGSGKPSGMKVKVKILKKGKTLSKRAVLVRLTCSQSCKLRAGGRVKASTSKPVKLKARGAQGTAGKAVRAKLRLTNKRIGTLRAGLNGSNVLRTVVTVRVKDEQGRVTTVRRRALLRA